jgi:hypothetical protein
VPARAQPAEIRRLILTASGGPFRDLTLEELQTVGPDAALRHPTWQMGRKITIDSATLMNKGLEVIEAHWLFDVSAECIDVVVHPQSIVHSMVELNDGSVIAQLGSPTCGCRFSTPARIPTAGTRALPGWTWPRPGGSSSTSPRTIASPAWGWPTGAARGRHGAGGPERGQRGGRGVFSRGTAGIHVHSHGDRADVERAPEPIRPTVPSQSGQKLSSSGRWMPGLVHAPAL